MLNAPKVPIAGNSRRYEVTKRLNFSTRRKQGQSVPIGAALLGTFHLACGHGMNVVAGVCDG